MKILLDENGIQRSITRISYEIIERNKTIDDVVLVGIKSRGDILAERIKQKLKRKIVANLQPAKSLQTLWLRKALLLKKLSAQKRLTLNQWN